MYNQPTTQLPSGRIVGSLYKNPIDCLWKTVKTEGPLALYKGTYPQLRHFHCFYKGAFFLQARPPTSCELPTYVSCSFDLLTIQYLNVCARIITLTANDVIIGLYKRLRRGLLLEHSTCASAQHRFRHSIVLINSTDLMFFRLLAR